MMRVRRRHPLQSHRLARILLPLWLLAGPILAQEDDLASLADLDIAQLMVIAVSKHPDRVSDTPALVTVYTREQLDRLQPRTILELLELTSGFHAERDLDDMILGSRGIITDNNQKFMIAIDGHRVSNTANFGTNPFHRTRHLIEIAERIEIVHGPGGVLWGPDAFLGLVNIVTRKTSENDRFAATVTYGPTDNTKLFSFSAHHEKPIEAGWLGGDRLRTALFADYINSDGEEISTRLTGRGGIDTTPGTYIDGFEDPSATLNFRAETDDSWLSTQLLRINLTNEQAAGIEEFNQAYIEIGHKTQLSPKHGFSARGYFDFFEASRDVPLIDLALTFGEDRWGTEFLLQSEWSEGTSSILGLDSRYHQYDRGELSEPFQSFPGQGFFADGSLTTNGLFGQLELERGKWLFHLGGRYDDFNNHLDSIFTPRLSAAYRFDERYTLKVRYNEASLRPSWAQFSAFFSNEGRLNFDTEPEDLESIEAQLVVELPRYRTSVTGYRTEATGTIGIINSVSFTTSGATFGNFADYSIDGIEWENSLSLAENVDAFWNLTYFLDLERTETQAPAGVSLIIPGTNEPYGIPDLFLNAGVTFSPIVLGCRQLRVTPIARYKSSQRFAGLEGVPDIDEDRFEADLRASLELQEKLSLALYGRNIFDNQDVTGLGQGDPGLVIPKGATWELSLRFEF